MEDNKEMMNSQTENAQTANVQPGIVQADVPAAEPASQVPAAAAEAKKEGWGSKAVTRKFLIIALAITLVANAALSAGVMALFAKNSRNSRHEMPGGRGPESGFFSDDDFNDGNMPSPPGDMQNGSDQQGQAPGQSQDQGSSQSQTSKASIGIVIREDNGVYVAKITGDNAKKAGFQEGDKVVSVDGNDVSSSSDMISQVQSHKSGDKVKVVVERDGQSVEITTELE